EPWTEGVLEKLADACRGGAEGAEEEGAAAAAGAEGGAAGTTDAAATAGSTESGADSGENASGEEASPRPPAAGLPAPDTKPAAARPVPAAVPAAGAPPSKSATPLYVLYGSATGNAEHIAKDLCATYEGYLKNPSFLGYFPGVVCCELNQWKKKCSDAWTEQPERGAKHGVIVVCSTTGNANAPENADRFVRWMKRKTTEPTVPFRHCAYAVLGLGDSNYDVFCATGKSIDKRLSGLGGTRAVKAACADEATGLEETVEPWVGSVIGKLIDACKGKPAEDVSMRAVETGLSKASTARLAPKKLKEASSSIAEEKKMEADEAPAPQSYVQHPSAASGVATVRALLSLPADAPLPVVRIMPKLMTSRSSCQLIADEAHRPRGDSIADNATVSSASSGYLYTAAKPYESQILGARYLTDTDRGCAGEAAALLGRDSSESDDDKLVQAMEHIETRFPLSPTSGSANSTDEEKAQCDRNGKRVVEMTLSLPDDFTLEYEPGDSVGLIVPNAPESVRFVLAMLERNQGISPLQKVSVDAAHPITVREAVQTTVDLSSPLNRKRLHLLSEEALDPEEKAALRLLGAGNAEGGSDLLCRYIVDQRRTIVDVLKEFPSCQAITLEGLLSVLPAIPPRYYSVCSSPLQDGQRGGGDSSGFSLKVAFSVVDYLAPLVPGDPNSGRRIGGLATRRLECICSAFLSGDHRATPSKLHTVQIFPKPTHEFRLPSDTSTPLVLVGPGTGIAPFIGFLSHRQAQAASLESAEAAEMTSEGTWRGGYDLDPNELKLSRGDARGLNLAADYASRHQEMGEIDLFFGCRHENHDYLYREDLEAFRDRGILTNLYTAFSRDGANGKKTYVQTLMREKAKCSRRLAEMIVEKRASVYVCGDGNAMGKDVQEATADVLAAYFSEEGTAANLEDAQARAVAHVNQMKTAGRFVLDIWS
ncbi:hypothetical protein ACHAWF_016118, partial [Thalassiosira exigua]